jgi:hypothetical protein
VIVMKAGHNAWDHLLLARSLSELEQRLPNSLERRAKGHLSERNL